MERLKKIAAALKDYHTPEPVAKDVAEKTLQITFDQIVKEFTQYERLDKHTAAW